jgi:hypothetical protein
MKRHFIGLLALLCLAAVAFAAGDKNDKSSDLRFVVVRDYNGKPVRNASVILHSVGDNGKQEQGGFQLKTNEDGKTEYSGAPYGKLRVQVIAHGFQTFGQDYDVNQPEHEIVIKLKRPQGQYSIYEDKKDDPKQ